MEPTRCLMSVRDCHSLLAPLGESKRIKYICVAASQHYVVLGANTGGVYCFHRDGYKYIRILANKEGGVSLLRFSPLSENILAAVTGGGYVAIWELNLHEQGVSKRFHVSPLLKDSTVRDVAWDSKGTRLFYGDDVGRVGVAYIPKQKLFKKPDEICLIEKSSIVQLDYYQEMLLVSTQQRSLLFKPSTREAVQVGKKTRDGLFGACFHSRWQDRPPVVYSARPGGRLWEADIEGTVLSTLKLKDLVMDGPPASPIFGVGFQPDLIRASQFQPPKLLHFSYLSILHNTYMVGVADHTLFLFNPASYKLAARSCDLGTIVNLYCDGQQLFSVCEGGRVVRVVDFMDVGTCVCELVKQGLSQQAILLVDRFSAEVQSALYHDGSLYKAVKSSLSLAQSNSAEMSVNLQAVLTTLSEVREKFETSEIVDERESEHPTEKEVEIKVEETDGDGYQTVDLNAYSDTNLTQPDTDDTNVIGVEMALTNGPESDAILKEIKVADTEPDLDATLMDDDTADQNDHSDIEMDPLASSSQTKLVPETTIEPVSPLLEGQVNIDQDELMDVKDAENLTPAVDIQTQPDHSDTPELTPLIESDSIAQLPARSKSKAIPPRAKSASQQMENSEIAESSSNSFTSATPSSIGGYNKISLSEPHSLDRQGEQSENSPLSLGGSLGFASVQKSKGKSDFAQRVETALNKQLSVSSIASNEGEDDLIAIPVSKGGSGNIGGGGEGAATIGGTTGGGGGGKGKKRKSKRKKNHAPSRRMSSPDIIRDPSYAKTPSPGRSSSLHHIEEETLPFPEAGLPPTPPSRSSHPHTPHGSEPTSLTVSPYPSLPSSPPRHTQTLTEFANLSKNASALFSKVKTLTTQLSEKIETQQTQKQVKNVVKDIFSSLAIPQQHGGVATGSGGVTTGGAGGSGSGSAGSHDVSMTSSHLFQNNDFALPISPQSEPEMGEFAAIGSPPTALSSDQSDGRISAPMSPPPALISLLEEETSCDPKLAEFSEVTMEAMGQLEDPMVLCSTEEITSLLIKWLQSLESLAAYLLTGSSPSPTLSPAHSTQASTTAVVPATCTDQQETQMRATFEEISKAFYGESYQNLSDVVKKAVGELATLCAEMEVFTFQRQSSSGADGKVNNRENTIMGETEREKDSSLTSEKERETNIDGITATTDSDRGKDNGRTVSEREKEKEREVDGGSTVAKDSERGKENAPTSSQGERNSDGTITSTNTEKEREKAVNDSSSSSSNSVQRCSCLVDFIHCYGPLLDSVRLKQQLLSSREWGERRECLTALSEPKEYETCTAESDNGEDPGGNTLTRLISKPGQFLEHCIKHFPTLLPWEIAVVCGIDQWDAPTTKSCDGHTDQSDFPLPHHHSLYVDYISQLFSSAKESVRVRGLLAAIFRGDPGLLLNTLDILLRLDQGKQPNSNPTSNSDTPRAWSHVDSRWPSGEICGQLVDFLLAMDDTELLETARNLCQKRSYWVGVVQLSVAMGDKRTALRTMLQLRDKRLFSAKQRWGNLLTSLEDWELLVELVNDLDDPLPDREYADSAIIPGREGLQAGTTVTTTADQTASEGVSSDQLLSGGDQEVSERVSVNQAVSMSTDEGLSSGRMERCYGDAVPGSELTQLEMLKLMLGSLPPLAVSKLLSSCNGNCFGGKTREQLHSVLSKLTSIHTQQRSLAHSMLERVDSYLWTQRPTAVGPQVVTVQNLDKQLDQSKDCSTPTRTSAGGMLISSVPPTSSSIEDATTHWGVIVGRSPAESGGHCPICRLPLTKPVSDLQPGIMIFQCGHSYHKLCLPEQACLVCFNKNSQRLLATYLEQV